MTNVLRCRALSLACAVVATIVLPFAAFGKTPKAYDTWHFCLVLNRQETPAASTCMNLGNNHNVERYGLIRFLGLGD